MTKHPFLLAMPSYAGSLAAVRCLGRRGVDVTVAYSHLLAAARWSCHAARTVPCPPIEAPDEFLAWLLEFGDREPKHVLYAPSDDIAYLIACNAAELGKRFLLYQPEVETLVQIQDKKSLHGTCESLGIDTVETWYPEDETEVQRLAADLPYPVLIKARTQVLRTQQTKGDVVDRREDLVAAYRSFVAKDRYYPGSESHFSAATKPMIQRFLPKGAEAVLSVTGFIDRAGSCFALRASQKVFLRTRPVGIGLCFEAALLEESLVDAVLRLCREIGYFGVFEIEFVRDADRVMVIDFNPRFYGQMGFDDARGLPLAYLAWLGATGDTTRLYECIAAAAKSGGAGAKTFTHRFVFNLVLRAQRLSGSISASECANWRRWLTEHADRSADAFADAADPLPGIVQAVSESMLGIRSMRRVFRRQPPANSVGDARIPEASAAT